MPDLPYSLPNTYNLYYLYPNKSYGHYRPDYTRYDEVIGGREKNVFSFCKEIAALGKMKGTKYDISKKIDPSTEVVADMTVDSMAYNDVHAAYLVELVLSIINNAHEFALVMVKNDGICPNLDSEMMLEATCLVGSQEIMPLSYGEVPQFEKGLLENQFACEKLLVDAIFEKDDLKLLQAFTENRIIRDAETAKQIIADFKIANEGYWPEFG